MTFIYEEGTMTRVVKNLLLMTAICVVVFWVFMALRPVHAQSTNACVNNYVMSKMNDPRSRRMRARIQQMKDRGAYEAEKDTLRNASDVVSMRREAWRACGLLHLCG
jgi:hypothetical protein